MDNQMFQFSDQALFLVWGGAGMGPRSRVFARKLGIRELHFIELKVRRSAWSAPLRYVSQAIQTLQLLFSKRPKIIFVQNPPSFAVMIVAFYCWVARAKYVIDAHSAAFTYSLWTKPAFLIQALARWAVVTIVTNEHFQRTVQSWGGRAFVLRDIPTNFPTSGSFTFDGSFNVVVVNTFSPDEPLREIIEAAKVLENVHFYITGKKNRAPAGIFSAVPDNVTFTDFLPDETYYALLDGSDAVMCLTLRDHTMQRGACEALSMGKPIITSDWPLLKDYFSRGTVHVDNSVQSIRLGIEQMENRHEFYVTEIGEMQRLQLQEWQEKASLLNQLIMESMQEKQGE